MGAYNLGPLSFLRLPACLMREAEADGDRVLCSVENQCTCVHVARTPYQRTCVRALTLIPRCCVPARLRRVLFALLVAESSVQRCACRVSSEGGTASESLLRHVRSGVQLGLATQVPDQLHDCT